MILPLCDAAHALAQVEDEVGPAADIEPAHVVPDGNALHLMIEGNEDAGDVVDRLHHPGDVLGGPVIRTGVVEDDDPHADIAVGAGAAWDAACSAPTSDPVMRRHAIRATSWMSSS